MKPPCPSPGEFAKVHQLACQEELWPQLSGAGVFPFVSVSACTTKGPSTMD